MAEIMPILNKKETNLTKDLSIVAEGKIILFAL